MAGIPSGSSHDLFHSFCVRPDITFENQAANEEVVLVLRAAPVTQIPWIINVIILFILLIIGNIVFFGYLNGIQAFFLNFFLSIFILGYAWLNILVYIFNVGIITNKKITDVDFSAIVYKEVTEAKLDKIEDVTSKAAGYFESLFNYGDVFVQTAGTDANIEFIKVKRPSDVVNFINDLTGME